MDKLLVTIQTQGSKFKPMLPNSALKHDVRLLVLQQNEPWVSFVHNKVRRLREELLKLPWDLVVYADCSDVFLLRDPFPTKMPDCGFLYSGETNCFPWPNKHKRFYNEHLPFPYPNAGVWAATRGAFAINTNVMLNFEDDYEENGRTIALGNCDQLLAHEMVIGGHASVDSLGEWCLNLYGVSNDDACEHIDNFRPALVHGSSYENKARTWDLKRKLAV